MSCGAGHRCSSDPTLLWLWHRPAAVAPTGPLVWEPTCATSTAPKSKKKEKKRCSVLLAIRKKDTITRYHYTYIGMAKIKLSDNTKYQMLLRRHRNWTRHLLPEEWESHLEDYGRSYKTEHAITYNPEIMLLDIYPPKMKTSCPQKNQKLSHKYSQHLYLFIYCFFAIS